MNIRIAQIPPEGMLVEEAISASSLDYESEWCSLKGPLHVAARVMKITNAVSVEAELTGVTRLTCSRCIETFEQPFERRVRFAYVIDKDQQSIDVDSDIREEVIFACPLKPLCQPGCKGLCPKCGANLNEGGCSCGSSQKKTL